MADIIKIHTIISVCIFNIFLSEFVLADYCEFGLCESEEYCCGDNKCCKKTLDLWFFWAGVLLVMFALIVAAGVRYTKNRHATYVLLTQNATDDS